MKKKNLIILLMFPFLISVFCIATINTTYNMIDVDISFIDWDYEELEDFQIGSEPHKLTAVGVNQRHSKVSGGETLIWSVVNKNRDEEPHAEVYFEKGAYYLRAISPGEVVITCTNEKGNVHRSLNAIIYKDAFLGLYVKGSSQANIDPMVYFGQYDHTRDNPAQFEIQVKVAPEEMANKVTILHSDNVTYDKETRTVKINQDVTGVEEAYLTIVSNDGIATPYTYNFSIVEKGVNVYTYDDLLNCTNNSKYGEIVVLQRNFESLGNTYVLDGNGEPQISFGKPIRLSENTELFGHYDLSTGKYSFGDEVYDFRTTYRASTNFIDQWNQFSKTDSDYSEIPDHVWVGLRVRKDFYGNGYTINMHNLTYPYSTYNGTTIPRLTDDNLFRGPLKMYSLGDPNNSPLVSLYGQDNIGMYVEGNGIVVNDVNLKNCDFGDRVANLDTVGTVLEIYGDGVTIKNSKISNGKNVVRSFSSNDLLIDNCILSNSRNFLFLTGSNEYVPVDRESLNTFKLLDGQTQNEAIKTFLGPDGDGDEVLNTFIKNYCQNQDDRRAMRAALESIQKALNSGADGGLPYKGSTVINDTYFYRSGISSICLETLFNSPFLESSSPSLISDIFEMIDSIDQDSKSLVPYVATQVSGVAYPVEVTVTGSTRFYDYKEPDKIELDGLIEQHMTEKVEGFYDGEIGIDTVFPLRTMLMQKAKSNKKFTHTDSESELTYVNVPVTFYGGGVNLSKISFKLDDEDNHVSASVEVDLLDSYLGLKGNSSQSDDPLAAIKGIVYKTVPTVTGFEPFKFAFVTDGYLYGEAPQITDLKDNAKGE